MRTVVLVPGSYHGPWCWWRVMEGLDAAGVRAVAVELPFTGLDADVAATRSVMDGMSGPFLLCGHSYGGMVISAAASARANVDHLVYLCALQTDRDESFVPYITDYPSMLPGAVLTTDRGREADLSQVEEMFYADCSAADVALAKRSLRPMNADRSARLAVEPAWHHTPSTYVCCSEDRALHLDAQRIFAARATRSVTWKSGHSPFLSRPELVVGLLAGLASSALELVGPTGGL
ncbi:MAG: alpha/beta fold hydrolase [Acidimicrobiales bacterium]